ncbi:MAG: SDR family oxidoreductase [Flavobacteriales bacterium]|jgi:NAD(P)-dependent dehydrogenase (short-subunit alcohol dehydrogenase family)|nr:SDR family oxidoreductase [Flavobacteriales bacterium]
MNILVTGGASGLGASISKILAKNPENKIYFTYASSQVKAFEICKQFDNMEALFCDFSEAQSLHDFLTKLGEMDIDILINNALTGYEMKHFHKLPSHTFVNSFVQNVQSTVMITQELLKHFKKKKNGRIITVLTSYLINKPPVGLSEYVANKAYLHSMVKSWATEFAKYGIASNAISPSFMQTNLTSDTDERIIEGMEMNHPLKTLLTTDEVAEAVEFLTRVTPHYNGQNLVINGSENI